MIMIQTEATKKAMKTFHRLVANTWSPASLLGLPGNPVGDRLLTRTFSIEFRYER